MVNVSIIKIFYSVLIFIKCKRSVDLFVLSPNKFVLIRNASIFIDKTVLLKRIFQYDFLLITAPHKFGKTTNLHMIKMFLGNNNPKHVVADVFRNTNIWRDREFIVKHVANYPIIHCSMKAKSAIQSFADLKKELKTSVSDSFLEHKYLLQSTKLGLATKKRYIEYCKSQVDNYEVGLKFLSKVLHMHHGKRVTVLIDDFDYALTYSIFKKELDSSKTAELLFRFIDNTINLNEYVGKSVVMGCVPFKLGAQYSGLYLLEHFKFMVTKDFTPYFGFTQRETERLLDKFQLGKFINDVSKWYGGYAYLHSDFQIYNPWSVLMFLKNKKLDIYWVARSSQRMLYNYLEPNYQLKEHLSNLVKKKNVTIEAVSSFTSYEVDKLKNVQFASYSYAEDYTEDHLFLQLLLESGYLTYAQKYKTVPISTKVKIPNFEIQKVFEQIVLRLAAVYPDINRY